MKILILGGTGAMGAYTSSLLAEKGNEVTITTMRSILDTRHIHYLHGNAHDIRFMTPVLEQHWDLIIDFMLYQFKEFKERVDKFLGATNRYVFLSSARVYAESDEPISEDFPRLLDVCTDNSYLATEEYALAKAREENLLINNSRKNWIIIRPYITYADQKLQLGVYEKENWLYRVLHDRTLVFPSDISQHVTTLTYGYDVAKILLELSTKRDAEGEIFNIACNTTIHWSDVLTIYQETLKTVIGKILKVKMLDNSNTIYAVMRNKYQVRFDRLFNRIFNSSKVESILGHPINFTPPSKGLRDCLTTFLTRKIPFKELSVRLEAYQDFITHEYTCISEFTTMRQRLSYIARRYLGYQMP